MPKWVEKILKYYRSLKAPFAIYLDLEQSCKNNPEKLFTEKKGQTWAFSLGNVYKIFI